MCRGEYGYTRQQFHRCLNNCRRLIGEIGARCGGASCRRWGRCRMDAMECTKTNGQGTARVGAPHLAYYSAPQSFSFSSSFGLDLPVFSKSSPHGCGVEIGDVATVGQAIAYILCSTKKKINHGPSTSPPAAIPCGALGLAPAPGGASVDQDRLRGGQGVRVAAQGGRGQGNQGHCRDAAEAGLRGYFGWRVPAPQ